MSSMALDAMLFTARTLFNVPLQEIRGYEGGGGDGSSELKVNKRRVRKTSGNN